MTKILGYKVDPRFPHLTEFDTLWAWPYVWGAGRAPTFLNPEINERRNEEGDPRYVPFPEPLVWHSPFGPDPDAMVVVAKKGIPLLSEGFDLENWDTLGEWSERIDVKVDSPGGTLSDLRLRCNVVTGRRRAQLRELVRTLEDPEGLIPERWRPGAIPKGPSCSKCKSAENLRVEVRAYLDVPATMYMKLTKEAIRSKEVQMSPIDWSKSRGFCSTCFESWSPEEEEE